MALIDELDRQVAAALRRVGDAAIGRTLVAAVSGGPDSVALLRSLYRLSGPFDLSIHVAHLDHDFRGEEAVEDARFVAALAEELGLPCTVEKQDPEEYRATRNISSFEQLAREMRYSFLADTARAVGASLVALGHTADDQAETVLLHVLRGSGLHGLRGMNEVSPWPWPRGVSGVSLFRPLLNVTKAQTAAYCRELGQPYREDSGNLLPRFTRNRVRRELLPHLASEYNPRIRESLLRLSRTASLELDFVESEVDRLWPSVAAEGRGWVSLDVTGFAELHPALRSAVLRRAYASVTGDTLRLRESHIQAMQQAMEGVATGWSVHLPDGLVFRREYGSLLMTRADRTEFALPAMEGKHVLELPAAAGEEWEDVIGGWRVRLRVEEPGAPCPFPEALSGGVGGMDEGNGAGLFRGTERFSLPSLQGPLTLRTRRAGDRFQPLGMTGGKKLQDFFTDARVPRSLRDRVPLLVSGGRIAWVVGYRVAEWAKDDSAAVPGQRLLWVQVSAGG